MRFNLLALGSAAAALGAAPLLGQAGDNRAPKEVMLSPDELLQPYYDRLRETVELPEAGPNPALAPDTVLTRFAVGSCNHQSASQHMWDQIASQNPQAFLMIGDNVYGDNAWDADAGLESLRVAYSEQAGHPEFARFRARYPMMATWDDHDYGLNDAGGAFPMRRWAETMFETFWNSSDTVRERPGIYDSMIVGPEGQRVQFILLDTRFFRSDMNRMEWTRERPQPYLGSYLPNTDPDATILGPNQWEWFEAQLAEPADMRVVVSSIQLLTEAHYFESWANFPLERAKLLDALAARAESGLLILTGDRHAGGIYQIDHNGEAMWELTSSSLNLAWPRPDASEREPDAKRVSPFISEENYGVVDIDWNKREVTMTLKGDESQIYASHSYRW